MTGPRDPASQRDTRERGEAPRQRGEQIDAALAALASQLGLQAEPEKKGARQSKPESQSEVSQEQVSEDPMEQSPDLDVTQDDAEGFQELREKGGERSVYALLREIAESPSASEASRVSALRQLREMERDRAGGFHISEFTRGQLVDEIARTKAQIARIEAGQAG
ncbi:hypothetical protein [uncultured Maritimibacter sp.]|uniref:hypothetical protein n=1 Tax=uncultured Maritimibacter sp. TaxID=991866 RepID=UPI002594A957|nr:hypothetical protein [uncultured Maritimibacter sp.]